MRSDDCQGAILRQVSRAWLLRATSLWGKMGRTSRGPEAGAEGSTRSRITASQVQEGPQEGLQEGLQEGPREGPREDSAPASPHLPDFLPRSSAAQTLRTRPFGRVAT